MGQEGALINTHKTIYVWRNPIAKLKENGQCKSKSKVQGTTMKKKKQNGDARTTTMKEDDKNANKLQQQHRGEM